MDGRTDERKERLTKGRVNGGTYGRHDRLTDRRVDGQMGQMGERIDRLTGSGLTSGQSEVRRKKASLTLINV